MNPKSKTCVVICAVFLACTSSVSAVAEPRPGLWRAWLDSPGGQLPFGLKLTQKDRRWAAELINGSERIEVPRVTWDGQVLVLDIEYYDSKITARPNGEGTRLQGRWRKRAAGGGWTEMTFHAKAGESRRFPPSATGPAPRNPATFDRRWAVRFTGSNEPAVAVFERQADGTIGGTFLTATGDYRYLAGNLEHDRLRLSCFDGAHAFLFDARWQPNGTLKGGFWSRDTWHETWTARPDPDAALPDPFTLTRWTSNARLGDLAFPDLDGKMRSLTDPAFAGKARIIEVFGSWCPNCNDAAQLFVKLDRRYRPRGLKILGLAFELTGDLARDTKQVRKYVRRHGIDYPILIAGLSDKDKATEALPVLDRVRSYPTTIFLDAGGRVRAIYTGFSGPATGEAYRKLQADFESLIEELLGE